MTARTLPPKPSEEHLRKEAKRLAKANGWPIAKAQRQLAQDYGLPSWPVMLRQVRAANSGAPALPPLIEAAFKGDATAVDRLIAAGEGLEGTLWYACDNAAPAATRLAIVTRLLDAGATPRTGTEYDKVPLHAAARRGPWALVDLLLRRGALDWQQDSRARTANDYARAGSAPDRELILHNLARPVLDDADFAAAVAAIHAGDLAALRQQLDGSPDLLRRRAREPDCYPEDYFRDPKLFWFVANNPNLMSKVPANIAEIAAEMTGRGVERTDLDYTLELAMSSSPAHWGDRRPGLIDVLLTAGAKPTREALLVTLGHAQREPIRHMLRRGLSLTAPLAAGLGQTDALPGLLATASQADKQAALSLAIVNGEHEAARLSLTAGADPNVRMSVPKHAMPVHSAISNDDEAMLRLLVESGASLDVTETSWNSTPAGWAKFLNKPKCQAYLASLREA